MLARKNIEIKTAGELAKMRVAGRAVAEVLEGLNDFIRPGITTKDIDNKVAKHISSLKMRPSFLGYGGFPASACVSLNSEVVHGIPDDTHMLTDGDIVSIDVGAIYEGYHADSARTYAVGKVSSAANYLLDVTECSLAKGIEKAQKGARLGDISFAVQSYVEENKFSVVRDFVGHGIGRNLHEEPAIPNYGKAGTGVKLESGMVLAIEPMVNLGGWQVKILQNGWTVVTRDGTLSAHFEHTVAITDNGPEILTKL
jgi:methionyl aminopeptidase